MTTAKTGFSYITRSTTEAGADPAQRANSIATAAVTPEEADWRYALGAPPRFHASAPRHGHRVPGATVRYAVRGEKMPLTPTRELLPEQSTQEVNVYQVCYHNTSTGNHVYGVLSLPTQPGAYPALLQVPGAGVRGYRGSVDIARRGVKVLTIGIHGIPVTMDPAVYGALSGAALHGYWNYHLDDRDLYYYKRVYVGTTRSVDYIYMPPEFDGERLAVCGGSQGGAFAIITAALDARVKRLASWYPALSDLTGYLHNRAGGWPHMFQQEAPYYDVVNFARSLTAPGMYCRGFNDTVCPPTSTYAAYNVITAPKSLYVVPETGHWTYP